MMKRHMISISEELEKKLEQERKKRFLETIPETVRVLLSEYFSRPQP